jgi:hypothetical protein
MTYMGVVLYVTPIITIGTTVDTGQQLTLSDYRDDDLIPSRNMPLIFPGTTPQTWNILRHRGTGPAFVKVARRIYYRRRAIEAWLTENTMARTDVPAS